MLRILVALILAVCAAALGARPASADQGQSPPGGQAAPPSGQVAPPGGQAADPRAALLKRLPAGSKLEDLRPSPIPGIYEYVQGADIS